MPGRLSPTTTSPSFSAKGVFHHDEGFCRVGRALNVAEMPFENGPAHVGLKWIVVDQQYCCHVRENLRSPRLKRKE